MRVRTTAGWFGLVTAPLIVATAMLSGQTQPSGPQSVFRAATSTVSSPKRIRRSIRIEVSRPGLTDLVYRSEYTLPPPPRRPLPAPAAGGK